jgi:cytochrome bd-type quinol oxidase subunit 2
METFVENLFICWLVFGAFLVGYAIIQFFGLGIMKVLDRRTGKKKWWITGRSC